MSRRDRLLGAALAGAAALALLPVAGPAGAQQASAPVAAPGAPAATKASFAALGQALAAAMKESADALRAEDQRLAATRALDRARRLARFATGALGLDPGDAAAFHAAQRNVGRARNALQDGDPEQASTLLEKAASALTAAPLGKTAPPRLDAQAVAKLKGHAVLGPRGKPSGELQGFEAGDQSGGTVLVSVGGVLGIGARTVRVPADQVLLGHDYEVSLTAPPQAP